MASNKNSSTTLPEEKQDKRTTTVKQKSTTGDGIRSIRTTNVFRIVNFELYARPNIIVMTFGIVGILVSGAYLAYMNTQMKKNNTYVAIADDESEILMARKSKWD